MTMSPTVEYSSTALVKVHLGQVPSRIPLPSGHVVIAVDGMERRSEERRVGKECA